MRACVPDIGTSAHILTDKGTALSVYQDIMLGQVISISLVTGWTNDLNMSTE